MPSSSGKSRRISAGHIPGLKARPPHIRLRGFRNRVQCPGPARPGPDGGQRDATPGDDTLNPRRSGAFQILSARPISVAPHFPSLAHSPVPHFEVTIERETPCNQGYHECATPLRKTGGEDTQVQRRFHLRLSTIASASENELVKYIDDLKAEIRILRERVPYHDNLLPHNNSAREHLLNRAGRCGFSIFF